MSSCFPEADDILSEIFKRLPTEVVGQCMSVQKSWYHLIKTSAFKFLHFNYQKITNYRIIFQSPSTRSIFSTEFDGIKFDKYHTPQFSQDISHLSLKRWRSYGKPTHGLVCLAHQFLQFDSDIYLWNPTARILKILPQPLDYFDIQSLYKPYKVNIAMGYSSKMNDLNVVRVLVYQTLLKGWSKRLAVMDVYSLNSNSWKSVAVKDVVELFRNVVVANGVVYCWDEDKLVSGVKKMVSFNIENEVIREIVFPGDCLTKDFVIEAFGESVSLLVKAWNSVIMWVLEDEKENGIWKKKISISLEQLHAWPPLGFGSNGELVLKTSDRRFRLVFYSVETGEKLDTFELRDYLCFGKYVESDDVLKHVIFMDSLFLVGDLSD